jgi:hypothetical protein
MESEGSVWERKNDHILSLLTRCIFPDLTTLRPCVKYHLLTSLFGLKFQNYGGEVIEVSNSHVQRAFSALETLSVTVTAFVKEQSNNGYPIGFVKVPDTEYHFTKAAENARACMSNFQNLPYCRLTPITNLTISMSLADLISLHRCRWFHASCSQGRLLLVERILRKKQ